jgi:hypothetical protein
MNLSLAKYLIFAAIATVNLVFLSFAFAEEKDSTTMNNFLTYLETELFSESSDSEDFLHEYRTGHWSWDISKIVNAYTPEDGLQGDLTQTIEASISDFTEYSRFSDEEADKSERAYRINRYYLDPLETDYLRSFSKYFKVPVFPGDEHRSETRIFEVAIRVFKKHGADQNNIEANLFWRHQ